MKKLAAFLGMVLLAGAYAHATKTGPAPEDPYAKQSADEMMVAAAQITQVNHCPGQAGLMSDEVRAKAVANVNRAIERFGEYDVGNRAAQLHAYLEANKKMDEFCARFLKPRAAAPPSNSAQCLKVDGTPEPCENRR
jgi:hypothetical protein